MALFTLESSRGRFKKIWRRGGTHARSRGDKHWGRGRQHGEPGLRATPVHDARAQCPRFARAASSPVCRLMPADYPTGYAIVPVPRDTVGKMLSRDAFRRAHRSPTPRTRRFAAIQKSIGFTLSLLDNPLYFRFARYAASCGSCGRHARVAPQVGRNLKACNGTSRRLNTPTPMWRRMVRMSSAPPPRT